MRAPSTVNGGSQHWTMLNSMTNGAAAVQHDDKNGEYGEGELKPITNHQTNGVDGTVGVSGGDEDEYLTVVDQVSLKDEKHKDLLLARLNTLRRNRELCDVVLLVDKHEIYAHKAVLAAVSPTLFELLRQSSLNSNQRDESPTAVNGPQKNGEIQDGHSTANATASADIHSSPAYIELKDVDYDCFEALISYVYSGCLEIHSKKVAELYKTASHFRMKACALACAKYLVQQLSPQNCIHIRKCANRTNDSLLASKVDSYIQINFAEIFQTSKEFLTLPSIQLEVVVPASKDRPEIAALVREEWRLGEKALEWLYQQSRELPDHAVFRMEMLTEKTHMVFLDDDMTLQDCRDMDDTAAVALCDMIQDYKKSSRRSSAQTTSVTKTRSRSNVPILSSPGPKQIGRVSSSESMSSVGSEADEVEWKIIAIHRTSETYFSALAVIRRQLAALSIHVIDSGPMLKNNVEQQQDASDSETYEPLATMEIPRCSVGAVSLNGKLIVCGGYDRGECLNSVEQYNPETNSWLLLPAMDKERGRFNAAVVDNKVYAVGGSDGSRDLNSAERFDAEKHNWEKFAPMLNARSNHGIASTDGYVYAIGGSQWQRPLKNCERYDCVNGTWTAIAPLQHARYQAGCCAWSNEILAVGGFDTWNCTNTVECYDPITNAWRQLPSLGIARRGCGIAVLKDQLYAIGGFDGTQALCHVEILDLNEPQAGWRPGPSLNTPRDNVRAVVVSSNEGDRLYVVGGFNGKSFLNSIEYLDEAAHEWSTVVLKSKSCRTENNDNVSFANPKNTIET